MRIRYAASLGSFLALAAAFAIVPTNAAGARKEVIPPGDVALPAAPPPPAVSRPSTGTVTVLHVPSADDDVTTRDVWVYRPGVPDSATLPVVYFLHGLPGKPSDLFKAGGAGILDAMFTSGVAPFVVAAPDGEGNAHEDTEWADALDGEDRVEPYVVNNVINAVEGANRRDRAHRIIAGFSMGGYGAVNLALRHADLFGGAASFSGYFHVDDPDHMFGNDPNAEAFNAPDQLINGVHDVQLFLAEDASEGDPLIRGEAQRFAALARAQGVPTDLVIADGDHDNQFVVAHLPDLAKFVETVSGSRATSTSPPG